MKARYIQRGESIDFTPTAPVAAGDVVKVGALIGVAKLDIKPGELGALATVGVYEVQKTGLTEFAAGEAVAYDFENGYATTIAVTPGATLIGHAVEASSRSSEFVLVRLQQGLK